MGVGAFPFGMGSRAGAAARSSTASTSLRALAFGAGGLPGSKTIEVKATPEVMVAVVVVEADAVTRTVDVDVAGLMERKEEQKGVALCSFRTSTIVMTLEHCAGVRSRVSSSLMGDALAARAKAAAVHGRETRILIEL